MTIYVTHDGAAMRELEIHSGHYGDWHITVTATGITPDNVDFMFVGRMQCINHVAKRMRTYGLIWDEARTLVDLEGYTDMTERERDALTAAGFNLYNYAPGRDSSKSREGEFLENVDELEAAEDFDSVSFIMDYEDGALGEAEIVEGFQHMLDTGLVWQLHGSYQRAAVAMLDAGLIHHKNTRWGD